MVGYVVRMGAMRNSYKISIENVKGRGHLEDLDMAGRIILEWILGK
jgi:hypothetical protein